MIACQGNDGGRPFAARKSLDHAHGAKTAVDIIAQEYRHGMVERPSFHIGLDALGHLPEQVVTTVNIAHAVYPSPIRDTTRSRNRGRHFPKRLEERIHPPHGFAWSSPSWAVSLNRWSAMLITNRSNLASCS